MKGQRALQRKRRACLVPLAKRDKLRRTLPGTGSLKDASGDAGESDGDGENTPEADSASAAMGEAAAGTAHAQG